MSEIDDARSLLTLGLTQAFQLAMNTTALLQTGSREARDATGFWLDQTRRQQLHSGRLREQEARIGYQAVEHRREVAVKDNKLGLDREADRRKEVVDGLRGAEIVARAQNATKFNARRIAEVDARITRADQDAESTRTRNGEIHDAKLDGYKDRAGWGKAKHDAEMARAVEDAESTRTRNGEIHDAKLDGYKDRAGWGKAKHDAEIGEIDDRREIRRRAAGLTETLADQSGRTAEQMKTAAEAAAAHSTANLGDRQRATAEGYAERAAEDADIDLDQVAAEAAEAEPEDGPLDPQAARYTEDLIVEEYLQATTPSADGRTTEPEPDTAGLIQDAGLASDAEPGSAESGADPEPGLPDPAPGVDLDAEL